MLTAMMSSSLMSERLSLVQILRIYIHICIDECMSEIVILATTQPQRKIGRFYTRNQKRKET